jgi:peroxiredoxin
MKKNNLFSLVLTAVSLVSYSQIAEKAEDISPLLVGETLPNEQLVNLKKESVALFSVLKEKPTVLVFYRGGWCPYCNAQLSALAASEDKILKLGYQIVAISPEDYQNLQPTMTNDKIKYQVYSDPKGNLIQKAGLAFKTPAPAKAYIASKTKGEISEVLPVPTVMIVNTKGEILFEYINPDYKKRLTPELLLAALSSIEK